MLWNYSFCVSLGLASVLASVKSWDADWDRGVNKEVGESPLSASIFKSFSVLSFTVDGDFFRFALFRFLPKGTTIQLGKRLSFNLETDVEYR